MGISVTRGSRRAVALAVMVTLAPAWGMAQGQAAADKRSTCSTVDYQNDARLGPKRLPNSGPLATVLKGYHRLAGMTAKKYLKTYYDTAGKTWRYPPQGGYQLTPEGQPVKMQLTMFAGQRIDRFGSEFGGYLSPEGTPYSARAIPPQSLDNATTPESCNYSRYKVLKDIPVYSGPIAEGLGQPGFGLQYVLDASIFPGAPATGFNVGYLVTNGYLQRVNDPPEGSYGS
jgi:Tuberculosis necrotizing toxin